MDSQTGNHELDPESMLSTAKSYKYKQDPAQTHNNRLNQTSKKGSYSQAMAAYDTMMATYGNDLMAQYNSEGDTTSTGAHDPQSKSTWGGEYYKKKTATMMRNPETNDFNIGNQANTATVIANNNALASQSRENYMASYKQHPKASWRRSYDPEAMAIMTGHKEKKNIASWRKSVDAETMAAKTKKDFQESWLQSHNLDGDAMLTNDHSVLTTPRQRFNPENMSSTTATFNNDTAESWRRTLAAETMAIETVDYGQDMMQPQRRNWTIDPETKSGSFRNETMGFQDQPSMRPRRTRQDSVTRGTTGGSSSSAILASLRNILESDTSASKTGSTNNETIPTWRRSLEMKNLATENEINGETMASWRRSTDHDMMRSKTSRVMNHETMSYWHPNFNEETMQTEIGSTNETVPSWRRSLDPESMGSKSGLTANETMPYWQTNYNLETMVPEAGANSSKITASWRRSLDPEDLASKSGVINEQNMSTWRRSLDPEVMAAKSQRITQHMMSELRRSLDPEIMTAKSRINDQQTMATWYTGPDSEAIDGQQSYDPENMANTYQSQPKSTARWRSSYDQLAMETKSGNYVNPDISRTWEVAIDQDSIPPVGGSYHSNTSTRAPWIGSRSKNIIAAKSGSYNEETTATTSGSYSENYKAQWPESYTSDGMATMTESYNPQSFGKRGNSYDLKMMETMGESFNYQARSSKHDSVIQSQIWGNSRNPSFKKLGGTVSTPLGKFKQESKHQTSMDKQKLTGLEIAQSALLNRLQKNLTCPHCSTLFKDPYLLPCQHTLCYECIHKLTHDGEITCPDCGETTKATNFSVNLTMVEMMNFYKQESEHQDAHNAKAKSTTQQQLDSAAERAPIFRRRRLSSLSVSKPEEDDTKMPTPQQLEYLADYIEKSMQRLHNEREDLMIFLLDQQDRFSNQLQKTHHDLSTSVTDYVEKELYSTKSIMQKVVKDVKSFYHRECQKLKDLLEELTSYEKSDSHTEEETWALIQRATYDLSRLNKQVDRMPMHEINLIIDNDFVENLELTKVAKLVVRDRDRVKVISHNVYSFSWMLGQELLLNKKVYVDFRVNRMLLDKDKLWCLGTQRSKVFQVSGKKVYLLGDTEHAGTGITATSDGHILIAAMDRGLMQFDEEGNFKNLLSQGYYYDVICTDTIIYGIRKDNIGAWIWLETFVYEDGIYQQTQTIQTEVKYSSTVFSAAIANNYLYLCKNEESMIYKIALTTGKILGSYGSVGSGNPGELRGPNLCGTDNMGRLLCNDYCNNCLQVLDPEKSIWSKISANGLKFPLTATATENKQVIIATDTQFMIGFYSLDGQKMDQEVKQRLVPVRAESDGGKLDGDLGESLSLE